MPPEVLNLQSPVCSSSLNRFNASYGPWDAAAVSPNKKLCCYAATTLGKVSQQGVAYP